MADRQRTAEVEIQVPFHDADPANIVWHGNFYRYFEVARTALMRMHNLDVSDIVGLGHGMVVSESRCRHVSPAHYGDKLRVRASFVDADHRIEIGYVVDNDTTGRTCARGRTSLVCITPDFDLMRELPDEILARMTTE